MYFSTGSQLGAALGALPAGKTGQFLAFDALYYSNTYMLNGNTTALTPIEHFVQYGAAAMAKPNATFDPVFYKQSYADLAASSLNAADLLYHFMQFGLDEGRAPNATLAKFDGAAYLAAYPAVATYVNANLASFGGSATNGAIAHYVKFGAAQGFTPVYSSDAAFTLVGQTAAGADVMRLTGDMDARLNFTNPANQITGLDLNGNGTIKADGVENNITGKAAGFEIVDAYSRNPLNQYDNKLNFLGDINFDGTGFAGDGVNTDGNVFLGGLGSDVAYGGIGNDFLAGGSVGAKAGANALTGSMGDALLGGRNADFFFAELSQLDHVDGDELIIDGGRTADDTAAGTAQSKQDADWLLLEASDDDEPVTITLNEGNEFKDNLSPNVTTASGRTLITYDVENLNASGNLYGFIDDVNVELGGRGYDSRDVALTSKVAGYDDTNYGIGSSAQINVTGSSAANVIIAGYDNDAIAGAAGDDLLFGGDLRYIKTHSSNPNLATIVNDGVDSISGGDGNDSIVLELDGGSVAGDSGNDSLWLTDYTIARPAATEALSVAATVATPASVDGFNMSDLQAVRIDLGYAGYRGYRGDTLGEYTKHLDEANSTSTSNHVAGTADQTVYAAGYKATTITGMENIIATGLGQIDYLAAGTNDPELKFANQQNYNAMNANLELRGTDGQAVTVVSSIDGTNGLSATEIEALYAQYLVASGAASVNNNNNSPANNGLTGAAGQSLYTLAEFKQLLSDGGLSIQTPSNTVTVTTISGGSNVLYASTGNDILEGRSGNDSLSGGLGNDDFVFQLANSTHSVSVSNGVGSISADVYGDHVDVIHRQTDAINNATKAAGADNIWDGTFERDFGIGGQTSVANSKLTLTVPSNDLLALVEAVQFVNGGTSYKLSGLSSATYTELTAKLNTALHAIAGLADNTATLNADNTITITDASGSTYALASQGWFFVNGGIPPNGAADWKQVVGGPVETTVQDRLIYKAYQDRSMNEGVDDNGTLGSTISLGNDSYAQDLVIDFSVDVEGGKVQTRIAEDQAYTIAFKDLKSEDIVKIQINGVVYELQVDKNLNGTLVGTPAAGETNDAFVARLAKYINQFMDDDTAVGAVDAAAANGVLTLVQRTYNGEQTVFMKTPMVTLTNLSGGQIPVAVVTNVSSHEVHLLDFDGQNAALNKDNVLFVGEEFTNRSYLETAKTTGGLMNSTEAMVINAKTDDLQGITVNLATKVTGSSATDNFSVHGDDFLLTGAGVDTVRAGTGDDRVEGSLGADDLDGGKNYYQIQVLNETKARVVVMNEWEAANPAARVASLANLIISSTKLIDQTQNGTTIQSGDFNDTLVFQQSDFKAGVTDFTVVLDGFNVSTANTATLKNVEFRNDGSGHVLTDLDGNNIIGTNITTFNNFENIRTVSGINRAVAGDGQGNDTVDLSALSTATFGVSYDLTNAASAGDVRYANVATLTPANVLTVDPTQSDYLSPAVIKVDGVETVIGGLGNDLVTIDETEAAKNNLFSAGLGTDRIDYVNDYNDTVDGASEPTVTINVTGTGTNTVVMTEGALGLVSATDTLVSVERIALNGNTAEGIREDDVLNVTAFASGIVVDYTNGQVRTGQAVSSGLQVTIENMYELENVWADGNDTVIVADKSVMGLNARTDFNDATPAKVIQLGTYLDFDQKTVAGTGRETFAAQVASNSASMVSNQNQFTFDMSRVGVDADVDTIDYSNETGQITAVMNFIATDNSKYVLVGSPVASGGGITHTLTANTDRVDRLISVEQIVAAQGANSTIDLTNSDRDVNVVFSYNQPQAKTSFVEGTQKIAALDRQINIVRVSDAANQAALGNVDLLEYRDLGDLVATATLPDQIKAVWENVQGSDKREYVELTQWEDGTNHTFNLRGGQNEVNYNERTNGIKLTVNSVNQTVNGVNQQFDLTVTHLDTNGVALASFDTVYGFNASNTFNEVAAARVDALRIEASQGDRDIINVAVPGAGIYLLGEVETSGSSVVTATIDGQGQGLVMSGFEYLLDGTGNDTFTINNLSNFVSKLTLIDNGQAYNVGTGAFTGSSDRDTIKLTNGAFTTAVIRPPVAQAITVGAALHMGDGNANDLQLLGVNNDTYRAAEGLTSNNAAGGTSVGFDFKVLDISAVTATSLGVSLVNSITAAGSAAGTTDELIVGGLQYLNATTATAITNFDILSLTGAGGSYDLDFNALQLQTAANVKIVGFDADLDTLDLSRTITSGNTVTVTSTATAATVIGSAFADTITGGNVADVITGGAGADVLSGGVATETYTWQLSGIADSTAAAANRIALTISVDGTVMTVTEALTAASAGVNWTVVDGASWSTMGTAVAGVINANLAAINSGAGIGTVTGAAFDGTNVVLSFASGVNANDVVTIVANYGATPDTGTFMVSSATNVDGGNGGNDTFVYAVASDSTAAAADVVTVTVGDIFDFGTTALDGVTAGLVVTGAAVTNLLAQLNTAFAANDATASGGRDAMIVTFTGGLQYLVADQDSSDTITAADTVIQLVGTVTGLTLAVGDAVIA